MTSASVSVSPLAGSPELPVYVIRPRVHSDEGFIAKSWVGEFRSHVNRSQAIPEGSLTEWAYARVKTVLARAEVRVAGPPDDDTTVYGFAVLEPGTLHMVYVRKPWRKMGICNALIRDVRLEETSWTTPTRDMEHWIRHRYRFKSHKPLWMEMENG